MASERGAGPKDQGGDWPGSQGPDYVEEMPTLPPQEATAFGLRWRGHPPSITQLSGQPDEEREESTAALPVLEPEEPSDEGGRRPVGRILGVIVVALLVLSALVASVLALQPGLSNGQAALAAARRLVQAQALSSDAVRSTCSAGDSPPGPQPAPTRDLEEAQQSLRAAAPALSQAATSGDRGGSAVAADLAALRAGEAASLNNLALWLRDRRVAGCYLSPKNDLYYDRAAAEEPQLARLARRLASDWRTFGRTHRLAQFGKWSDWLAGQSASRA